MDCETFLTNLREKFTLNTDLDDIIFNHTNIETYIDKGNDHGFGEKDCLIYTVQFTILNVNYSIKFLSFVYDKHGEILKLEILINNELLEKEISSCRNFLQRKRNLNLTFIVLRKISNLYESRRLICQTVLQTYRSIQIESTEYSVNIKCNNYNNTMKLLEVDWCIAWNPNDCQISDGLEFYCNQIVLNGDGNNEIRQLLEALANLDLNFHTKLKLWRKLIRDLYKNELKSIDLTDVQEISDTEDVSGSGSDDDIVIVKEDEDKIKNKDDILIIE